MLNGELNIELSKKEQGYTFFLSLVAFSMPWGVELYNLTTALLFLFLGYMYIKEKAFVFPKQKPVLYLMIFVLIMTLTLLYTSDIIVGVGILSNFFHILFWGVILLSTSLRFHIKPVILTFVFSCVLLGLKANIEVINHIVNNGESLSKIITFYNRNFLTEIVTDLPQPIYFSLYLLGAWLMSFYLLKRSKFIHQILFWIYTIYTLFILYILSSKVAILFIGFYLGVLFVSRVLWLLKVKQNILFSMVTITVLAILIYSFRLDLVRLLFGEGESVLWHQDLIGRLKYFLETGDPVRHENWKASLIVIKENLFFGVGVGDAIFELQKLRSPSSWAYVEGANTHNQFLGITVAGGLIAMVSFLAFVVSLFNESIKAKSLVLTYFILLLMVFMFIENIFARHAGVIFFAFFLFLFVRANEIKKC